MIDGSQTPSLEVAAYAALGEVYDPEMGVDLVNLGLIYRLDDVGEGNLKVEMTMTSPGCPIIGQILENTRRALDAVEGVKDVDLELVWSPPWTPEMMSLEAKMMLGMA